MWKCSVPSENSSGNIYSRDGADSGAAEAGCTVHLADHEYDHGPILLQKRVPGLPGDTPATLAERVFGAECEAYPEAILKAASAEVRLRRRSDDGSGVAEVR